MRRKPPSTLIKHSALGESKPLNIELLKPWLEIVGGAVLVLTLIATLYSNYLSRQALTASQRAWVGIRSISISPLAGDQSALTYTIENFADSPALEVQNIARLGGTHPAEELHYLKDSRLDTLMPHETRDSELMIGGETATNIFNGKEDLLITLVYRDIFGTQHSYIARSRSIGGRMMVVNCTAK